MIYVILLEPVNPGNIGAVARAMANFGFSNLVLINPQCDHLSQESRNRAKHAQEILENAEVNDFFVVDDYDYLIATTARLGTDYNIQRSPLLPEQLAEKISSINPERKTGIVIGRETYGMFNEEIAKCDFVVTIPSSKKYPTMNISHAVAVILYEIYKKTSDSDITGHIMSITKPEKDQIKKMFNEIFDSMQWETKEKKETQQKLWNRIIGKAMLTKRESYGVMGFLRKVIRLGGNHVIGSSTPEGELIRKTKTKMPENSLVKKTGIQAKQKAKNQKKRVSKGLKHENRQNKAKPKNKK